MLVIWCGCIVWWLWVCSALLIGGFCLVVFDVVCVAVFVHLFVMISWIAGVCLLLIDIDLVPGLVCIRWFVYADLLWG